MKSGIGTAFCLAGGYLLGRRRKMRWLLLLAAAGATGKLGGVTGQLVRNGTKLLSSPKVMEKVSPALGEIIDTVRGDLLDAGKAAASAAVSRQITSLSDSLHDRAESLRNPVGAAAGAGLGDLGVGDEEAEAGDGEGRGRPSRDWRETGDGEGRADRGDGEARAGRVGEREGARSGSGDGEAARRDRAGAGDGEAEPERPRRVRAQSREERAPDGDRRPRRAADGPDAPRREEGRSQLRDGESRGRQRSERQRPSGEAGRSPVRRTGR